MASVKAIPAAVCAIMARFLCRSGSFSPRAALSKFFARSRSPQKLLRPHHSSVEVVSCPVRADDHARHSRQFTAFRRMLLADTGLEPSLRLAKLAAQRWVGAAR